MIFISSEKVLCHYLLVINSNLGPISQRFRDMATYSLKLSTENCGQTAADGDMDTIDSLSEVASALSDDTIADPIRPVSYTHLTLPTNREV